MTDEELVERARSGDSGAFSELVVRHHRAAMRAAIAALGSADAAEDAVQDAWIVARARLSGFRREASFRTWLLSIVWNKSLDHRRSVVRLVRRLVSLDEHPGDAGGESRSFAAVVSASDASPEAGLLHHELRRTLARLVKTLPARLRDPLLLVGTGEYLYDEVAAMLGQPVGTVKWRVSDARRQIRIKLERLGLR